MKGILLTLFLSGVTALAQDLSEKYAAYGQVIYAPFASAPFPHPEREKGHAHGTNFFDASHYHDNHVVLFIPKNFHPGAEVDFVVHFHGWGNTLTNVLPHYNLIEQFSQSGCQAILVVPQGPQKAADSFDGKLEDQAGFARFMAETMDVLRQHQVVTNSSIGRIILSGHSGGYQVISSIVAWGGLNDHIQEVWLFDALYAKAERFAIWFDHHPGRFVDLYTTHGGTKEETEGLMVALTGNKVPFFSADETNATPADLQGNRLVFLFSELPHDQVMQERQTFRHLLETSALSTTAH